SLVDPDNRRPVHFAARTATLAALGNVPDWPALAATWPDAQVKLALTRTLVSLRQNLPAVFTHGAYAPLEVEGRHANGVIAFNRTSGHDAVIVAVGRLFGRASGGGRQWPAGAVWDGSIRVERDTSLRNVLTRETISGDRLSLSEIFKIVPV